MAKVPVTDCPAGPALDAAVAEVLGWRELVFNAYTPVGRQLCGTHPSGKGGFDGNGRMIVTKWSAGIAAAWELIETMGIKHSPSLYQIAKWHCNFMVEQKVPQGYAMLKPLEANGLTAPLAITRAFLLAHGASEVEVADD